MVAASPIITAMPARLEPDYMLLNVADGVVLDEAAPGLAVTAAPRRAARGREKDILFLAYTPVVTPTEPTKTPPANLKFGNFEFDLTLFFNNVAQHGVQFAVPVTLTIGYDPALLNGLKEETLEIYYWDGTAWTTSGITDVARDTVNHTITIAVSHLSQYGFFAQTPTGLDPGDDPALSQRLYLPAVTK